MSIGLRLGRHHDEDIFLLLGLLFSLVFRVKEKTEINFLLLVFALSARRLIYCDFDFTRQIVSLLLAIKVFRFLINCRFFSLSLFLVFDLASPRLALPSPRFDENCQKT